MRKVSLLLVLFLALGSIALLASCDVNIRQPKVKKSTIVLIDRTDGITKEQRARFFHEITFLKDQLNENDQLIIYDVPGSYKEGLKQYKPLFSATIPPNPEDCNEINTTCGPGSTNQKNFDNFEKTFSDTFANISFNKTSDNSYILESIRMIIATKKFQSLDNKKFVIFSNMLQNSKAVSHYRKYNDVSDLRKHLYILHIDGTLSNTEVYIFMLPDQQRYQTKNLNKWWVDYFNIGNPSSINIQTF